MNHSPCPLGYNVVNDLHELASHSHTVTSSLPEDPSERVSEISPRKLVFIHFSFLERVSFSFLYQVHRPDPFTS